MFVEALTANEFMTYLAAGLGQLDEVNSTPVTDSHNILFDFISSGSTEIQVESRLKALRLLVLNKTFPSPSRLLSVDEIERFKSRHGDALIRFRNLVEQNIVRIADMNDSNLQKESLTLFQQEIDKEIEDIKEYMKSFGWVDFIFGKLFSIVAPAPDYGTIFGLMNALYNFFRQTKPDLSRSPLLYAAEAQRILHS
jgi:hypothetical protein